MDNQRLNSARSVISHTYDALTGVLSLPKLAHARPSAWPITANAWHGIELQLYDRPPPTYFPSCDATAATTSFTEDVLLNLSRSLGVYLKANRTEPLSVAETVKPFLNERPVLWIGESSDGLQIGPLLRTVQDAVSYERAIGRSRRFRTTVQLAGSRAVPTSYTYWLARSPTALLDALSTYLDSEPEPGTVLLFETGETKRLPYASSLRPSVNELMHDWDKGLAFGLANVEPMRNAYLAVCESPMNGPIDPTVNSGKGSTPFEARMSALGECVERFSTWDPLRRIITVDAAIASGSETVDFGACHPGGRFYRGQAATHYAPCLRAVSHSTAFVPDELVYTGPFDYPRSSHTFTTGLAAHTNDSTCLEVALNECIERNNLYPNITNLARPILIVDARLAAISSTLIGAQNPAEALFFTYPQDLFRPVAHCLLFSKLHRYWIRGTGSGNNFEAACRRALLEAMQLEVRLIAELESCALSPNYAPCVQEAMGDFLYDYLSKGTRHSLSALDSQIPYRSNAVVISAIERNGHRIYFHKFKNAPQGWHVRRVIITGFSANQFTSASEGGRKIGSALGFQLPH